jgi:hypothetical protein
MMAGLEVDVKYFHTPKVEDDGVNVGWFEDQTYEDGLPIAMVARWNEFGTKAGIPQRPFMRRTMMKHEKEWIETLKTIVQREIDKDKNINIDKALKKFGEIVKGDIQETILEGGFVKNAPATVKKKGFNMPLVDTGVMISSIQARTDKELLDV